MPRGRTRAILLAVVACLLLGSGVAGAQEPLGVSIQQAQVDDDGATEAIVAVTGADLEPGTLPGNAFAVLEDDQPVADLRAEPVAEETAPEGAVMLLLDASGSTEGQANQLARAAARDFARTVVEAGLDVGVVTFADTARLVLEPTADLARIIAAIDAVAAEGETALYDALGVAATALEGHAGQLAAVAFTDGADTASSLARGEAADAIGDAGVALSTVALQTPDIDLAVLRGLTRQSGGSLVRAGDAAQLGDAFGQVATNLTNRYVLAWDATVRTGELDLTVTVAAGGAEASDSMPLLAPPPVAEVGDPRVVEVADPGLFAQPWVLYGALALLFGGLLAIAWLLVVPAGDQRVARTLERGLRAYQRTGGQPAGGGSSALGRRAVGFVDAMPKPSGYDDRLQQLLERAAWPLRASELTALRALAAIAGLAAGWILFGHVLLGILVAAAGWVLPRMVLDQRVNARRRAFMRQLPDTLQLLAGSLKAGYGVLQGIDTIVKETSEPTASEFRQVLTESRLGLPLDDSLEAMAERIGSDDFRWVTVAIAIQRRVGGNLAELLETIAATLREREMVRRQVSSLSAEGRLSAVVLTVLPVVLALYMVVVNPQYIGTLFTVTIGRVMVVGAVVLMGIGVLWMRRLIDVDV